MHGKPLTNLDEANITRASGGSEEQTMSKVFVLNTKKQPLNPVHPARARLLLKEGKAAVFKRYPFTLILKTAVEFPTLVPLHLKIDPGSHTTGMALLNDATGEVVFACELIHRGKRIKKRMDARRAIRRTRRQRTTRYRQPRFQNRHKRKGVLPPSLESRVCNVMTWAQRLMQLCPIAALSQELVKFDLQLMQNPAIQGIEYQQGTLAGYEAREYLLEKWQRKCAYCGAQDVPLQIEHIQARAKSGTNRISNLTLACEPCNIAKGTQEIRAFLAGRPDVLAKVLAQSKMPLKDASTVNSNRWALYERLKALGLPVEGGSGGLTKFNRTMRGLPKTHWVDAANVGKSTPESLDLEHVVPLLIIATGHGNRQMCGLSEDGFPVRHRQRNKVHFGYQTGDLVRALVPKGKYAGVHVGRALVRAAGSFDIRTKQGRQQGISHRYCKPIHRNDGYSYNKGVRYADPTTLST
jgi:5-methylcytosine-specific restriction endonuclease McrA